MMSHADLPGHISESVRQARREIMSAFRGRSIPDAADKIAALRKEIDGMYAAGARDTVDGKRGRWVTVRGTAVFIPHDRDQKDVISEKLREWDRKRDEGGGDKPGKDGLAERQIRKVRDIKVKSHVSLPAENRPPPAPKIADMKPGDVKKVEAYDRSPPGQATNPYLRVHFRDGSARDISLSAGPGRENDRLISHVQDAGADFPRARRSAASTGYDDDPYG